MTNGPLIRTRTTLSSCVHPGRRCRRRGGRIIVAMLRTLIAAIAVTVLLAPVAAACAISVTYPVPVMARGAKVIVEATAIDTTRHFEVVRTFRGTAPARIQLGPMSNCDDPTRPGESYLVFLACEELDGCDAVHVVPATKDAITQLEARRLITQREIATMLRRWVDHRISDRALADWVRETELTARVDDWMVIDGVELSLSLHTLKVVGRYLDRDCLTDRLRYELAPDILRLLRKRSVTVRDLEHFERYDQDDCDA